MKIKSLLLATMAVPFTIIHKIDKEESVNQEKKERLKQFIEKFGKYTKPYNEIGKYFQEKEEESSYRSLVICQEDRQV